MTSHRHLVWKGRGVSDLQTIIDQIAYDLGRAIYLEDVAFRPLAASAQLGHIDDARVAALLSRRPTDRHLQYFAEYGVLETRTPLRIPADSEQGLLARVVIPVVVATRVVARVWLIDSRPPVSESDIARVLDGIAEMTPHLVERDEQDRWPVAVGERMVRGILRAGTRRRERLFRDLCDRYEIADPSDIHVGVVHVAPKPAVGTGVFEAVVDPSQPEELFRSFVEFIGVHRVAGYVQGGEVRAFVASRARDLPALELVSGAARRAAMLHGLVVRTIGISGALRSVENVESAYGQATFAARIAGSIPELKGAACWDDLGVYRLFSQVEWSLAGVASLHEGVAELVADDRMPLASTLLAYLEREGDVEETARALNVHRTTLYYRIRRAYDVLGEGAMGSARFSIHAALRLADLAGLSPAAGSRGAGESGSQ